jgi:hypothetical protein
MRAFPWSLAFLAYCVVPAQAALQIQDVRAVYGKLGPERTKLEYFPSDEVVYRYFVTGAKVDANGAVDCEVTVEMLDPAGKLLPKQTYVAQGVLNFGGNGFPGSAKVPIPTDAKPGFYSLRVGVKDRQGEQEANFQRSVKVSPTRFAIVAPHFTYDDLGEIDAPCGGTVDQTLYLWLNVIGFDISRKRIDTEMNIRVLDQKGDDLTPNPIRIKGVVEDPIVAKEASHVRFKGALHLNRAGHFTLSVTVIDRVGKTNLKFETPLDVAAPTGY